MANTETTVKVNVEVSRWRLWLFVAAVYLGLPASWCDALMDWSVRAVEVR